MQLLVFRNFKTTYFKFWQKNSPKYYVIKTFLEGYHIVNKTNLDVIDRLYVKALYNKEGLLSSYFLSKNVQEVSFHDSSMNIFDRKGMFYVKIF